MRGLLSLLMAVALNQHHVTGESLGELCLRPDAIGVSETLRQICREYFHQYGECLLRGLHRHTDLYWSNKVHYSHSSFSSSCNQIFLFHSTKDVGT